MKKHVWLIGLTPFLLLTACKQPKQDKEVTETAATSLEGTINKDETYQLEFTFKSEDFKEPSNAYNKDLSVLSYGFTLATTTKEATTQFYTLLGFDNLVTHDLDKEITEDTFGYAIGHKNTGKTDYVVLSTRCLEYAREWANNFEMGSEGNHAGFERRAKEVKAALDEYLKPYLKNNAKNTKVFLTGYSRGAAISNMVAHYLNEDILSEKTTLSKDNLFAYLACTPRGLTRENAKEYDNVFNLINAGDPIPLVAPEAYGLYRCGIDLDISSERLDEYFADFDSEATLPAFTATDDYETLKDFSNYLMENLLKESYVEDVDISTRANYVTNMQSTVRYMLNLIFGLKESTLDTILEDIQSKKDDISALITIISSPESVRDYLTPFLDDDGISYDPDELLTNLTKLHSFLFGGPGSIFLTEAMLHGENLSRCIDMHLPEVIYTLLTH